VELEENKVQLVQLAKKGLRAEQARMVLEEKLVLEEKQGNLGRLAIRDTMVLLALKVRKAHKAYRAHRV
jgi:hypothetical protein